MASLSGASVVIVGAGLAGLAAARDLSAMGATVVAVDARDRVGGRVWTIRDGFADGQHAEAGGDMIDEAQTEIRTLARELGLTLTRILRGGFGAVRLDPRGRPRIVSRNIAGGWARLEAALEPVMRPYRLAEQRWDSPIAAAIARRSVAGWLDEHKDDAELRATATGLRGFFLADPEELSLIALVDQFASNAQDAPWNLYRLDGGNDTLARALATPLGERVKLKTEVVAVSHRGRSVRVSVRNGRATAQLTCDYVLLAVPTTVVRRIPISPALPAQQHDAIARLKYGRGTKTLLQFSRRFWLAPGRPRAFGTPLPFGAFWDGIEEQRGRPGILTMLSGGNASDLTQAIVAKDGPEGLARALDFLGARNANLLSSKQIVWEHDPHARGGYAFFDPDFPPDLRPWLSRPCGRIFFAGEHTSVRWQGYMNGAVESGRRAAAEIAAVHGTLAS
jgi:monoamine oxidase